MSHERWEQISRIYHAALEAGDEDRGRFLAEACAGDPDLRAEVESLLSKHGQAGGFLGNPAIKEMASQLGDGPPSLLGRKLGPYQMLGLIGSGGMGEVYKALDTRLNRSVAIKVLPRHLSEQTDLRRRFEQEARAIAALSHPHICSLYDIGSHDGIDFLVMEYLEGETLSHRLKQGPLPLRETLRFATEIASALEQAHRQGVIHRDLKPGNIMLTESGAKLLDFGLAKARVLRESPTLSTTVSEGESLTEAGMILGTPGYMSPEQVRGEELDARSDIFSFGSVLYEMVTGQKAFSGTSRMSTISAILREEPKPVSAISRATPTELQKLISRCLQKEPARRFPHATELKAALEKLKADSDSKRPRFGRAKFALLAAVLLLVMAAVPYWLMRSRPSEPEPLLTAVPLTSYPGAEWYPSFSPDGNQVAFQWGGAKQDKPDIYVKVIGNEPPLRLTTDPASDYCPAWSPDGRWIAFCRGLPGAKVAVMLISPLGGPERKLAEANSPDEYLTGARLAWSADSRSLVMLDSAGPYTPSGLFLLSVETGRKQRLTSPPANIEGDSGPAISPDGRKLVFSRYTDSASSDLYLQDLSNDLKPVAGPRPLTSGNRRAISPAWTPDGKEIVFSTIAGIGTGLWRVAVSGASKPRKLAFAPDDAYMPALSRQGRRLAYTQGRLNSDIWRVQLDGPNRRADEPVRLITSSYDEHSVDYSPDGKRISFISERSGAREVWMCASDGTDPVQLSFMGATAMTGYPRWSPDGQRLVFDSTAEGKFNVYVVDVGGGGPRRLTDYPADNGAPNWSRDGRSIYFASNRTKRWEIWKMPSEGGEAVQVTVNGGVVAFESPDGRSVYFTKSDVRGPLWKVPVGGGEETKALGSVGAFDFTVSQNGIYSAQPNPDGGASVNLLSFVTGKTTIAATIRGRLFHAGLSVSPDGRHLLFAQQDPQVDLMLVEDFR